MPRKYDREYELEKDSIKRIVIKADKEKAAEFEKVIIGSGWASVSEYIKYHIDQCLTDDKNVIKKDQDNDL